MIHEDATRTPDPTSAIAAPRSVVRCATAAIAASNVSHGSAIGGLSAFADATRLASELRHALSWAAALAAQLPDSPARVTALRQLGELRGPAIGLLQLAPAPTAAVLAAAESDDRGAEQAAQHAHAALSWLGDQPSPARCRALRVSAGRAAAPLHSRSLTNPLWFP